MSLLAAVAIAALVVIVPSGKEGGKIMVGDQVRSIPLIDVQSDVSFETATFSLG